MYLYKRENYKEGNNQLLMDCDLHLMIIESKSLMRYEDMEYQSRDILISIKRYHL